MLRMVCRRRQSTGNVFCLIVLYMSASRVTRSRNSQFGRVVKAWDLKSHGVTRAGSNPAADVSFAARHFLLQLPTIICPM